MGILDSLKNDAKKVEEKVEEAVNPQAPAAPVEPEAPKEPVTPVEEPKEEVASAPVENATEVQVEKTKCPNCVDGLVGDPQGTNSRCTTCNGTGTV